MQKKVDLSLQFRHQQNERRLKRDTWFKHIRIDIITGRILGIMIISRNENGTYARNYASIDTIYAFFVLLLSTYFWRCTLNELLDHFQQNKVPGSYMLFIVLFSFPLPIIFMVESRKMPEFFNAWLKFQLDYREITGIELDFTRNYVRLTGYLLKVIFSVLFFILQRYRFPVLTVRGILFVIFEYWIIATLTSFWNILLFYLHTSGEGLHHTAKKLVRNQTQRVIMEDLEALWYDLYRLLKMTGQIFCFTYCYLILFLFVLLMVTAYETLIIVSSSGLLEKTVFIALTICLTLHTASIPFLSQITANKIGEDFYKLLLDLKTKERCRGIRPEELDGLLQVISDNQLTIDLGGFVTLDNGLITSLMSTMVTYLIVLVQFKV